MTSGKGSISWTRIWLPTLFSALLLSLLAILSRSPIDRSSSDAVVRLAWRFVGAKVQLCREQTPEELKRIPAHMRRPKICQDRPLPYTLQMKVDGTNLIQKTFSSTGVRADRPIYVFENLPLKPGRYFVEIGFSPAANTSVFETESESELAQAIKDAVRLSYRGNILLKKARITLIGIDPQTQTLKPIMPIHFEDS